MEDAGDLESIALHAHAGSRLASGRPSRPDPVIATPHYRLAVGALLALHLTLLLGQLWHKTWTYDEPWHLHYGRRILSGNADRFDDSKMPVSALNALPSKLAEALPDGSLREALNSRLAARAPTVIGAIALALVALRWSRQLYGRTGAFLTFALIALDPNLIAHGRLCTTDLWSALALTLTAWLGWRFLRKSGVRQGLLATGALAVGQLAKYLQIFAPVLFPAVAAISLAPAAARMIRERRLAQLTRGVARYICWLGISACVFLLVINLGFLFRGTGTALADHSFRSSLFRSVQQGAPLSLAQLPLPVPNPWLEGLDWVVARERLEDSRRGFGNIYLLGELRRDRGFPGYYLWASLFKVPLPSLILFLVALGRLLIRRGRASFLDNEIWLLGPVLFYFVYLNWFFQAQIGIRFLLPAFPLMHVLSGSLLQDGWPRGRGLRIALCGALTWLLISVLSYFPHYISYMNELVPDRTRAYRVLADSNLDWGQNGWWLERWQEHHPDALFEPREPAAGTVVVGVNRLTGVRSRERFRWLRETKEPIDTIAYSYLLYEVTSEDLERLPPELRSAAETAR